MNEISNKTLAVLVVIAIIVCLVTMFLAMGKVRIITVGKAGGNITVTVPEEVSITAIDNLIAFGEVRNDRWNNSDEINDWVIIQNSGTSVIDVSYWANKTMFIKVNGTVDQDLGVDESDEGYKMKINAGHGCTSVESAYDNAYTDTYINTSAIPDTRDLIFGCPAEAQFNVGVHVHVPLWEPSGDKISELNFQAEETI